MYFRDLRVKWCRATKYPRTHLSDICVVNLGFSLVAEHCLHLGFPALEKCTTPHRHSGPMSGQRNVRPSKSGPPSISRRCRPSLEKTRCGSHEGLMDCRRPQYDVSFSLMGRTGAAIISYTWLLPSINLKTSH